MAVLKAKARAKSAVVHVKGGAPSEQKFPIPDKAHARAALGRLNQAKPPLTPEQRAAVLARIHHFIPKKKPHKKAKR